MRKVPRQARAKALVASILQATEQAVREHGIQQLTTPKIADIAGVSVGSIYQYFDDKQQILAQLIEQKSHALGAELQQYLTAYGENDLEEMIRVAIEFGFCKMHDEFNRQIILHCYQLPSYQSIDVIQRYFMDVWQQILMHYYHSINLNHLSARLFIIINSTVYTMLRYAQQQPSLISQDVLVEELTLLICNYLEINTLKNPTHDV